MGARHARTGVPRRRPLERLFRRVLEPPPHLHVMARPEDGKGTSLLYQDPCFQEAMLWGLGCGLLLAGHKHYSLRTVARAMVDAEKSRVRRMSPVDYGVFGFTESSSIAWFTCRYSRRARQQKLQEAIDSMKEYQARKARGGAGQ